MGLVVHWDGRYNELDQAVCKVCNVVIKSEALWGPHLVSRLHKEVSLNVSVCLSGCQSEYNNKVDTLGGD